MRTPPVADVGDRPPPRRVGPLTQTHIVRFAGAGGDFNPLHHDGAFAATAGFDRPIAMGQLTAALLAAWLTDWCGVENLREYGVRFTAPLAIGDVVELSGEVTSLAPGDDARTLATMELAATRDGATLVSGRAVVVVADG
ncbi:MaoC family dehydratase [Streptomyces sp. NPDC057620]|uniref:MaoC family dehydratase n=1 Tax=Streptomyces sp. NPDC057620 TaxID=3346185 RepID=UPI00369B5A6B